MDWLDQHSGSVTAIATVVLVAITAFYVWLTRALATSSRDAISEAQNANRLAREANELSRQSIGFELEERLRRQASKVVAWVRPGHRTTTGQTYAVVEFENKSDEPVFECVFKLLYRGNELSSADLPIIGPGEPLHEREVPIAAPLPEGERAELEFTFTDNAGVRWRRQPTGDLSRIEV